MSDNPHGLELPEYDPNYDWERDEKTPVMPTKTMAELMEALRASTRPTKPIDPEVLQKVLDKM